jgi:hypothetical protein
MTERGEDKFTLADIVFAFAITAAILAKEGAGEIGRNATKITAPLILKHSLVESLSKPIRWFKRKP